ncbi:MAG: 5-(carboxyamino)imidazole ribonucleotide synthase [Bacteroidota bacterium]
MQFYQDLRLGIVGGGQLGRMLIQAAIDYNVDISVLDPSGAAPARPYAHQFVQGPLTDFETVYQFGRDLDVLTIEIENVNTEALEKLQTEGKKVYPDPKTIRMIQDKRQQKQFFVQHNLPTSPFHLTDNKAEVEALVDFLPAVQKLGRAGYDGRGVQVLKDKSALSKAFDAPGLVEKFVPFEKELAILVARNPQGDIQTYPLVEMVFHPEHNLVEYLLAPARIDVRVAEEAEKLARKLVDRLEYVGIMAIELFLTKDGRILINELAPRPHNSGHHSIRANATSQYEQHLRAILDLPLGESRQICPAAMVNLLGAAHETGQAWYRDIDALLSIPETYPHIYGKAETRPFRKMGHATILAPDLTQLLQRIDQARPLTNVYARPTEKTE